MSIRQDSFGKMKRRKCTLADPCSGVATISNKPEIRCRPIEAPPAAAVAESAKSDTTEYRRVTVTVRSICSKLRRNWRHIVKRLGLKVHEVSFVLHIKNPDCKVTTSYSVQGSDAAIQELELELRVRGSCVQQIVYGKRPLWVRGPKWH